MMQAFKLTKLQLSWLISICYMGLLLPIKYSNITLILLLAASLLSLNLSLLKVAWKTSQFLKITCFYFLVHIAGLLYTEDMGNGLFVLEKKVSLILLPLLVFPHLITFDKVDVRMLLNKIGILTMLGSLLVLMVSIFGYFVLHNPKAFYFENFTPIHYVYYAIYFSFGSLVFLDFVFDYLKRYRWGFVLWIVLLCYTVGMLILISSKMGIITFTLGASVLMYLKSSSKRYFFVGIILFILSLSGFIAIHDTTRNRFLDITKNFDILKRNQLTYDVNEKFTGVNLRLLFWKYSLSHLWQKKSYIVGVGTGDTQHFLDQAYVAHNLSVYDYKGWDPHNQWVFTVIQLGIAGVLSFALYFLYGLVLSVRGKDFRFFFFLLVCFCFSMTESILESNKGIVFFALLSVILFSGPGSSGNKPD